MPKPFYQIKTLNFKDSSLDPKSGFLRDLTSKTRWLTRLLTRLLTVTGSPERPNSHLGFSSTATLTAHCDKWYFSSFSMSLVSESTRCAAYRACPSWTSWICKTTRYHSPAPSSSLRPSVCGLSPSISPVPWLKSSLLCKKKLSEQWSPSDTTAGDQAWESASSSSFWSLRLSPPAYQMISLFRVDREVKRLHEKSFYSVSDLKRLESSESDGGFYLSSLMSGDSTFESNLTCKMERFTNLQDLFHVDLSFRFSLLIPKKIIFLSCFHG